MDELFMLIKIKFMVRINEEIKDWTHKSFKALLRKTYSCAMAKNFGLISILKILNFRFKSRFSSKEVSSLDDKMSDLNFVQWKEKTFQKC